MLLLGSTWPVTKLAVSGGAAPSWFAAGRVGLCALASGAALALAGRLRAPGRADLPALLAVGLLQFAGFFALSHAALAWVPAGRTAVLSNATAIWIVPLSLLALREPIPRRRWGATLLGLAGVAVLTGPWAVDWADPRAIGGHALLLAAALSWAAAMVMVRRRPPALSMLELLPWAFAVAAAALLPLALAHPPGRWDAGAWAALGFVGVLVGPVGTWCVLQATASLPVLAASLGLLATPAVGLLLAAAWLGEPLTPDLLAGTALILAAAFAAAPGRRAGAGAVTAR